MNEVKRNIEIFSAEVEKYKRDYWRKDEEWITTTFFEKKNGSLLVLGCGAGRTLIPLHQHGYRVTAIDITPAMVEAAQEKVKNYPIEVSVMDACSLRFENNTFDYAFFPFHGIDYVYPDIYKAVHEIHRVLKPDGVFVFNSHNRLALKQLHRFFQGPYATDPSDLITYRTTPWDKVKLKKYFKQVIVFGRTSIMVSWKHASWKDVCYKALPWFDKSTYFVCRGKR
ncbi:MAG: UbiE/COQ5 family methyltransferase [Parcubacteria group bacterium Gr01-1014_29]|nr:MAG: UbiE/COQ5 family methyltransferase [Parcubacteria group bacterium Gr01-1014_29]